MLGSLAGVVLSADARRIFHLVIPQDIVVWLVKSKSLAEASGYLETLTTLGL